MHAKNKFDWCLRKAKELLLRDRMLKELEKEEDFMNWAVKLQHSSRTNRINELKRKGLV